MRIYNRIFKDPDSDPEQDLYGMISNACDQCGALLMMYPRPVFVQQRYSTFSPSKEPIDLPRSEEIYQPFCHADRIANQRDITAMNIPLAEPAGSSVISGSF